MLESYTQGDVQKAFDSIRTVPPDVPDPRFFAHRASLLLAVGAVDDARADIERVDRRAEGSGPGQPASPAGGERSGGLWGPI
jgi:hypothetical protein